MCLLFPLFLLVPGGESGGEGYTQGVPVYEFTCNACGAPVSVFTRSISAPVEGKCGRCGSTDLRRVISRVAILRSSGGVDLDNIDNLDPSDPKAMAAWARQMQQEMGPDAGPEMEDMIERLERGESLDDDFDMHDAHEHDDDE
jgi:putative FmdB family regulatory protein